MEPIKLCTKCGQPGEFSKRKNGKDGLSSVCRKCNQEYSKGWYAENTDKCKQYVQDWNVRHPVQYKAIKRSHSLKYLYGLSTSDFLSLLDAQSNKCVICCSGFDGAVTPFVDHDHELAATDKRGSVRGLLCSKCNFAIGLVEESIDILEALCRYLNTPIPVHAPVYGYRRPKAVERDYRRTLREECGYRCMVCRTVLTKVGKSKACIDHDHQSGKVRGVLCHRCNSAIGSFQEDCMRIQTAAQYLRGWALHLKEVHQRWPDDLPSYAVQQS